MSKKSCINCRHHIDGIYGIYCKARSKRITSSNWFECGCPHFEKRQRTVFDFITQSKEKLAETLVHNKMYMVQDGILQYWVSSYFSTILPGKSWEYESEAIEATLEELKKEVKDESNNSILLL